MTDEDFFATGPAARRQAEIDALIARLEDPEDPYDAHHGTDRSAESLAWARDNDPETFSRVLGKIERGE